MSKINLILILLIIVNACSKEEIKTPTIKETKQDLEVITNTLESDREPLNNDNVLNVMDVVALVNIIIGNMFFLIHYIKNINKRFKTII